MKSCVVLASVVIVCSPALGSASSHPRTLEINPLSSQNINSERVAKDIQNILEKYRITEDIDKKSIHKSVGAAPSKPIGYEILLAKIQKYVKAQKPIEFLMIGFPFKSANQEMKVLGNQPDMAERRSFEYIHAMAVDIKRVYKPGAQITIFCDGIPFGEFLNISDKTVQDYEKTLKRLAEDLPSLKLITSNELQKMLSLPSIEALKAHIDQYGPSPDQYRQTLEIDPKVQDAYKTMLGRLAIEFDSPAGRAYLSSVGPNALENVTFALLAREMRLRSFVEKTFNPSQFIRLTVHHSKDVSQKFGIKLSPSSCVTPYHGVLVEETNGRWSIRFRKDISLLDYERRSQTVNGVQCDYMRKKSR